MRLVSFWVWLPKQGWPSMACLGQWLGLARVGQAWLGRPGRPGMARPDLTWPRRVWPGLHGLDPPDLARPGQAMLGRARPGQARPFLCWVCQASPGHARYCMALAWLNQTRAG